MILTVIFDNFVLFVRFDYEYTLNEWINIMICTGEKTLSSFFKGKIKQRFDVLVRKKLLERNRVTYMHIFFNFLLISFHFIIIINFHRLTKRASMQSKWLSVVILLLYLCVVRFESLDVFLSVIMMMMMMKGNT